MGVEVYFILVFLGFLAFLFWNWLFKKFITNVKNRKTIALIAAIVSAPVLYISFSWLLIFSICYYPNRNFDQTKWKNDPETRYELTKDLINSKILIGKTRTQVTAILGIESHNPVNEDLWYYELGFVPGIGIDPDILEIHFKNGRVVLVIQRGT